MKKLLLFGTLFFTANIFSAGYDDQLAEAIRRSLLSEGQTKSLQELEEERFAEAIRRSLMEDLPKTSRSKVSPGEEQSKAWEKIDNESLLNQQVENLRLLEQLFNPNADNDFISFSSQPFLRNCRQVVRTPFISNLPGTPKRGNYLVNFCNMAYSLAEQHPNCAIICSAAVNNELPSCINYETFYTDLQFVEISSSYYKNPASLRCAQMIRVLIPAFVVWIKNQNSFLEKSELINFFKSFLPETINVYDLLPK